MDNLCHSEMKHRQNKVRRLHCSVQNYDWGRKCDNSQVARLYALNSGSPIDPEKPYAEFWMGTHESGPSFLVQDEEESNGFVSVVSETESLKSWVLKNPKVLGEKVVQKWGADIPFLFKVFSISISSFLHRILFCWLFGSNFPIGRVDFLFYFFWVKVVGLFCSVCL